MNTYRGIAYIVEIQHSRKPSYRRGGSVMKGRLVWSEKHFCFGFEADELGFTNLDSLPDPPEVTAIEFRGVTYVPQKPESAEAVALLNEFVKFEFEGDSVGEDWPELKFYSRKVKRYCEGLL